MTSADSIYQLEVNGKWIYTGTLVHEGTHGRYVRPKRREIKLHHRERTYLVSIALAMLSAPGGDFDEDDTVYADIYSIDEQRLAPTPGVKGVNPPTYHAGYVYGHHFGQYGDDSNQGPTSYAGPINEKLELRLIVQEDDWAAATYSVVEL